MKFFIDMDDVVADWMPAARAIVNRNWNYGERIPDSDWSKVKAKQHFYRELPLKSGAHNLINWVKKRCQSHGDEMFFLTALPHDYSMPYAAQDKVWWAHEHFPGIPVFFGPFSHDKWRHCNPGDVLIDDRESNCSEWRSAGGLAHIYKTWDQCEKWLQENVK